EEGPPGPRRAGPRRGPGAGAAREGVRRRGGAGCRRDRRGSLRGTKGGNMRYVMTGALLAGLAFPAGAAGKPELIRSARSGPWSAGATWEGGKVPSAGARVQVREGHAVLYDVKSDAVIRLLHVAGTLTFARDRDTRLDVGLIKVQPGQDASEDG